MLLSHRGEYPCECKKKDIRSKSAKNDTSGQESVRHYKWLRMIANCLRILANFLRSLRLLNNQFVEFCVNHLRMLTLWQRERHFCHIRFTGAATILSFDHSMFTSLDSIGSAVGKRPIEHDIGTSEWPTE